MKVVIDTPVWSLALRRRERPRAGKEKEVFLSYGDVVGGGQAVLLGPVRQEILSGIQNRAQFHRIRDHLRCFEDEPLVTSDYEEAAEFDSRCREAALASFPVDLLICAVSLRLGAPVFTLDRDFEGYARVLRVALHPAPA